jgi:hypothetical protein
MSTGALFCYTGAKTMNQDARIAELLTLAEAEGLTLPYPPNMIIALEDAGHVVDLHTGAIQLGEADKPYHWNWTTAGEALAHLIAAGLLEA